MIRLEDERRFDCAPAALLALYMDPAFQERRSVHLGALEARCARRGDVLSLEETRDTGWAPHVWRSRMTTRWDVERLAARWTLERLEGPGDASAEGELSIAARGEGACLLRLTGTLRVRVPLLGGMIERLARRALVAERGREAAFVRAALRERAAPQ